MIGSGSLRLVECRAIWLCWVALSCGQGTEANSRRDPEAVAGSVVGALRIDAHAVAALQSRLGLPVDRARELVVEDALLAAELVRQAPARAFEVERVALARALLGALADESTQKGPPTDAEVEALTAARFWELDRPRMVQVEHVVVLSASDDAGALALAQRIASAVADASSDADFESRARAVPSDGLTVKVETLPPVAADGRAVDPDRPPPGGPAVQQFALEFAQAAQRLERAGQQSTVERSPFGYHVLRALRIIGPHQPSLEERRKLLREEVVEQRARELQLEILDRQRKQVVPEQERSAVGSMEGLGNSR